MERNEETLVPGLDDHLCLVVFDREAMPRMRERLVARMEQPQLAAIQGFVWRLKDEFDRTITRYEETSGTEMNRGEDANAQEKKASGSENAELAHGVRAPSR